MMFQLAEFTPVAVVLERATAVTALKPFKTPPLRKMPPGRHSNRVQSSSGEVGEDKSFLEQTSEITQTKAACCHDLTDIKWLG